MTTKKKVAVKKTAVKKVAETKKRPAIKRVVAKKQPLKLTQLELARLDSWDAQIALQDTNRENIKLRIEILALRHNETLRATTEKLMEQYKNQHSVLQGAMRDADHASKEIQEESNATLKEVEARLGIKMSDYIVGDNGDLRHHKDL